MHRGRNLLLIQRPCGFCYGHPAADHGEDTADNFSGRRINNQMVLPLRVLYIAVQRTRPQRYSPFCARNRLALRVLRDRSRL